MNQRGFSLVELMIALVLGLVISGAVIQTMISSRVTNSLNQSVGQVQESGRFIMARFGRELMEVGRYDSIVTTVDGTVDSAIEAAFVQNRPIGLSGDYLSDINLGAKQGASGVSDELVVNQLGSEDCTGNRFGYPDGTQFHVVNRYYVNDNKLYCTGYDGRVLRGLRASAIASRSVILMDNVESFQVQYGVTDSVTTSQGQAVRYVTASQLPALRTAGRQAVAIRLGILLMSDRSEVSQIAPRDIAVLNEAAIKTDNDRYYQVFTQTLALRNMKNFVRSL
ncbi:PilW family protein [Alteromonas confluentis]|uniref:Pilin n=1 Tax=Alteromonas confluentis TaxID=1656094 RepID=A0A1E7Z7U7_9ALTE|nr:PilW family protein [Alteromonas confluentis]OFC69521.1 pilin [Alteromonas confluentis]